MQEKASSAHFYHYLSMLYAFLMPLCFFNAIRMHLWPAGPCFVFVRHRRSVFVFLHLSFFVVFVHLSIFSILSVIIRLSRLCMRIRAFTDLGRVAIRGCQFVFRLMSKG